MITNIYIPVRPFNIPFNIQVVLMDKHESAMLALVAIVALIALFVLTRADTSNISSGSPVALSYHGYSDYQKAIPLLHEDSYDVPPGNSDADNIGGEAAARKKRTRIIKPTK